MAKTPREQFLERVAGDDGGMEVVEKPKKPKDKDEGKEKPKPKE